MKNPPNAPPAPRRWPRPSRRALLWGGGAALALAGFAAFHLLREKAPGLPAFTLAPAKAEFFHDEFISWTMKTETPALLSAARKQKLTAWVEKDGVPVVSVGNLSKVPLRYDAKGKFWKARLPVPWNAPDGVYRLAVDTSSVKTETPYRVEKGTFKIVSRPFKPIPEGFGVLTLESIAPMRNYLAPDGTKKDWIALVEWAEFMGADAIVVQGAESGGYGKKLPAEFPWITQSKKTLQALGAECHRRGLKLGVYLLCFMIGGSPANSPDYEYGWTYENGRLLNGLEKKTRRGASITDPRRTADIIKALDLWLDLPEIDFVGLDYIRPVFGGYELADDFARDMEMETPPGWKDRPRKERMLWIHQNRKSGRDFVPKWYWYRAHRTAQIVRAIKKAVGDKKPLWAFNLSWEKGWHHGQDPAMMRDAGIDIDAIMAYEADSAQYGAFVKQWNEYIGRAQANLLIGDTFDWPLHQRTIKPAGPEDFYDRNVLAVTGFHRDGPVRGVFTHDFIRGTRGRLGPYSSKEWMLAGGAAMTMTRKVNKALKWDLALDFKPAVAAGAEETGTVRLGPRLPKGPVKIELFTSADAKISPKSFELSASSPSAAFAFRWTPGGDSAARGDRLFLAARAERPGTSERCQIHIMYFDGQRRKRAPEPAVTAPAPEAEKPR